MTLDRWELLRTLGAVAADPDCARAAAPVLGLPSCGDAEHAEVFAFNCPPYAAAYLGGGGRLAAFWAALGLAAPPEPDHLGALLGLYAQLGETGNPARQPLFREHLWPWLPAYLGAVSDLPAGALAPWAGLTLRTLRRERELDGDAPLPQALREAPPPADADGEFADGLVTPLRSGIILTRRAVAACADQVGAGQRIGDRRRALRAMLAAEPERAARRLADLADRWARRHEAVLPGAPGDQVQQWWAGRATRTARALRGRYLEVVRVSAAD